MLGAAVRGGALLSRPAFSPVWGGINRQVAAVSRACLPACHEDDFVWSRKEEAFPIESPSSRWPEGRNVDSAYLPFRKVCSADTSHIVGHLILEGGRRRQRSVSSRKSPAALTYLSTYYM